MIHQAILRWSAKVAFDVEGASSAKEDSSEQDNLIGRIWNGESFSKTTQVSGKKKFLIKNGKSIVWRIIDTAT
jgi:hypothetical protein